MSELRWRCRRGMKEIDVLLESYLDNRYPDAGEPEQLAFRKLLDMQDPDLYRILIGQDVCEDSRIDSLLKMIHSDPREEQDRTSHNSRSWQST